MLLLHSLDEAKWDSLVRVSRRVGGATDLLATDMRPVQRNSEETTQIPVKPITQQKAPATEVTFHLKCLQRF